MKNLRDLDNRFNFQLDNKQLVLLFAGMVVILILAFILGTLFGRNLYSQKTEEGPVAAVAEQPGETPAPSAGATAAQEPVPLEPASPEEKEKQALIKELEAQKLPAKTPAAPATSSTAPLPPSKLAPPAKTGVEAPAKTAKAEAETKPAVSPLPASGSGPYCIQVASSQKREEAEALKAKLAGKKFESYLVKVELPGKGTWYRIRVGHYKDRAQAEKALRIFRSQVPEHRDAFVAK